MNPDILSTRILIRKLKKEYGARCKKKDFEPECMECRARVAIAFLEEHIEQLKSDA